MQTNPTNSTSEAKDVSLMSPAELVLQVRAQAQTITSLERQLEWYRRQVFGVRIPVKMTVGSG